MRIGAMLKDMLRSLFRRPATRPYPAKKEPSPARLRGAVVWNPANCIGCALCVKDCPANALNLITLDKKAKRFVIEYHLDRCIYCAQCVGVCRFNCLEMANEEWELADSNRDIFVRYYGDEDDVEEALANQSTENDPD